MHETLPCIIVSNVAFSRIRTKDKMREDLIDRLREAGCLADPPKLQQDQKVTVGGTNKHPLQCAAVTILQIEEGR